MVYAGVSHLSFKRQEFQAQVPDWFPGDKDPVVIGSGVVEILLGGAMLARADWRCPGRFLRRHLPRQHRPVCGASRRFRPQHRWQAPRTVVWPARSHRRLALVRWGAAVVALAAVCSIVHGAVFAGKANS